MLLILYMSIDEPKGTLIMTLVLQECSVQEITTYESTYDKVVSIKNDVLWNELNKHTVGEALEMWLSTLQPLTAKNYRSGMRKLAELRYIRPEVTLQAFAMENPDAIVDRVKKESLLGESWSECTRQARVACYISFTGFLSRRFPGMLKKATTCKEGNSKTFFRVHEKVKSNAMSHAQWSAFFLELDKINARDCLIAKITLQGGKRIQEVLSLTTDKISWSDSQITFVQSKTKGVHRETVISYPKSVMISLKEYLGEREGLLFITSSGKAVSRLQVDISFTKAGKRANIPFKVNPHVLRATAVTYFKQQNFSDSDIMKVTGHASAEMVNAYDKSSRADNASKKVSLVQ